MLINLIDQRENAMDRADQIIDANWSSRKGAEYALNLKEIVDEFKLIASEMKLQNYAPIEQSRVYRYLGSVYSDLAPELGKHMLIKSCEAYNTAEKFLEGNNNALELAKLNFNYGNALRLIDPNDIDKLENAKHRIELAGKTFAKFAPHFNPRINEALSSIDNLLKILPTAIKIDENIINAKKLEKRKQSGESDKDLAKEWKELMLRHGGGSGLLSEIQSIVDELPSELKTDDRFKEVSKEIERIYNMTKDNSMMQNNDVQIFELLKKRLKEEIQSGKTERGEQLKEWIDSSENDILSNDESIGGLMKKVEFIRAGTGNVIELAHYPSYGIPKPQDGTRASELIELFWSIRRRLLEEANRGGKGEAESKLIRDLIIQASKIDKRIYRAGNDDALARNIELDELRAFAHKARKFTFLRNAVLARPIWPATDGIVDVSSVFYSGRPKLMGLLSKACKSLNLSILKTPQTIGFANARWKQLQKANITVFDMGAEPGVDLAAVSYELGIALALGKSIVVVTTGENLPFDVDIKPIDLSDSDASNRLLTNALDQAIVSLNTRIKVSSIPETLKQILKTYPIPQKDIYLNQTLKQIQQLENEPDAVSTDIALKTLIRFIKNEPVMLIHPSWPPSYLDSFKRLFHVMPFRPEWADTATSIARRCCNKVGFDYIRGDEVREPDIILSIWDEIIKASHVLVNLTGFNANVALELGMSHTLGKSTLITGDKETIDNLFPMITKLRVYPRNETLGREFENAIDEFLLE